MSKCHDNDIKYITLIDEKWKEFFNVSSKKILEKLNNRKEKKNEYFLNETICFMLMLFPAKSITTEDVFILEMSRKIKSILLRLDIITTDHIELQSGWTDCFKFFKLLGIQNNYSDFDEVKNFALLYSHGTNPRNMCNFYMFFLLLSDDNDEVNTFLNIEIQNDDDFKDILDPEQSKTFKEFLIQYLENTRVKYHTVVAKKIFTFLLHHKYFDRAFRSTIRVITDKEMLTLVNKKTGSFYF